jgi:hypothetical protein
VRTWDAVKIGAAICSFLHTEEKVDVIEWLSNPANLVFENEHGDLAIFESTLFGSKIYSGHYYFKSRGKQAIASAKQFLDELFNSCYNIHIVMGLVPIEHLAAKWISRRIGLKSYGLQEIHGITYEHFILTKKEFNNE